MACLLAFRARHCFRHSLDDGEADGAPLFGDVDVPEPEEELSEEEDEPEDPEET